MAIGWDLSESELREMGTKCPLLQVAGETFWASVGTRGGVLPEIAVKGYTGTRQ